MHRLIRIAKRESKKAERDLIMYGTGCVYIGPDGEPRHVPLNLMRSGSPNASGHLRSSQ